MVYAARMWRRPAQRRARGRWALLTCLLSSLLRPATAWAHAQEPGLLELTERADGLVDLRLQDQRRAEGEGEPVLAPRCHDVRPPRRSQGAAGRLLLRTLRCGAAGLRGTAVTLPDLAPWREEVLLRVRLRDGADLTAVLRADAPTLRVPAAAQPAPAPSWTGFVALGLRHIAGGADHLLFLALLVLLVLPRAGAPAPGSAGPRSRPSVVNAAPPRASRWSQGAGLAWTLSAFTLAHSVTLVLATLGLLRVPAAPVEAAIALSIVILAAQVAAAPPASPPSRRGAHSAGVAFVFGLVHGLGFAGGLAELGVPRPALWRGLLGFNLGVELGQLACVAVLLALCRAAARLRPHLPPSARRIAAPRPLAYVIGALAATWLWQRVAAF